MSSAEVELLSALRYSLTPCRAQAERRLTMGLALAQTRATGKPTGLHPVLASPQAGQATIAEKRFLPNVER